MKLTTILDAYRKAEIYKRAAAIRRPRESFGIAVDTDEDALYWQKLDRQSQAFGRQLRAKLTEIDDRVRWSAGNVGGAGGEAMRDHELYYQYERRIADMQAENARLRAALEAVEWEYLVSQCPWCKSTYGWKAHAPNCARQVALGLATSGTDSAA